MQKKNIITIIFVILILLFFGERLYTTISAALSNPPDISLSIILTGAGLLACSTILRALLWHKSMSMIEPNHKISTSTAIKIFLYSWLGRYVPGKIGPVVGKIHIGASYNVSRTTLYLSSILDAAIPIITGVLLSIIFLPMIGITVPGGQIFSITGFMIAGIIAIYFIDSKYFYRILNYVMRLFNFEEFPQHKHQSHLSVIEKSFLFLGFVIVQLLRGGSYFLIVSAITTTVPALVLPITGIAIIATTVGIITLIMPSGIGVTEGVAVFGFSKFFSTSIAVQAAIIARLVDMVTDGVLVGGVYLLDNNGFFTKPTRTRHEGE